MPRSITTDLAQNGSRPDVVAPERIPYSDLEKRVRAPLSVDEDETTTRRIRRLQTAKERGRWTRTERKSVWYRGSRATWRLVKRRPRHPDTAIAVVNQRISGHDRRVVYGAG